jgi:hypothetical protein
MQIDDLGTDAIAKVNRQTEKEIGEQISSTMSCSNKFRQPHLHVFVSSFCCHHLSNNKWHNESVKTAAILRAQRSALRNTQPISKLSHWIIYRLAPLRFAWTEFIHVPVSLRFFFFFLFRSFIYAICHLLKLSVIYPKLRMA